MTRFKKPNTWQQSQNVIVGQNPVLKMQSRIYKASKANKKSTLNACQKKLMFGQNTTWVWPQNTRDRKQSQTHCKPTEKTGFDQQNQTRFENPSNVKAKKQPNPLCVKEASLKPNFYPLKSNLSTQEQTHKHSIKHVLEPEWEAKFHGQNGFGFQNSAHLALQHVLKTWLRAPIYVLNGPVEHVSLNHGVLLKQLNTWPKLARQIKIGLDQNPSVVPFGFGYPRTSLPMPWANLTKQQAGLCFLLAKVVNYRVHSACLKNAAYRGEPVLQTKTRVGGPTWFSFGNVLTVFANTHEELLRARRTTEIVLDQNKLRYGENVTCKASSQGFCYLGFQLTHVVRNNTWVCLNHVARPSKQRFLTQVRTKIQKNKSASSYVLIKQLAPVILGWANYFRVCSCRGSFQNVDHAMFGMLRAWAFRRKAPGLGRNRLKENLFPGGQTYVYEGRVHQDNWVLTGKNKHASYWDPKQSGFLYKLSWVYARPWRNIKNRVQMRFKLALKTNFNQEPDEMKVSRPDLPTGAENTASSLTTPPKAVYSVRVV